MNTIDTRFSPNKPLSCAQGRYGDMVIAQGAVQPSRWVGTGLCTDAGIEPPTDKPVLALDATPHFYVARTDVTKPGAVYFAPPTVKYEFQPPPPTPVKHGKHSKHKAGKNVLFREAKAKSYLEQSAVAEIRQDDGGKYYPVEPNVVLGDSHGKDGDLKAHLDAPDFYIAEPGADPETGLTGYQLVSDGPPWVGEGGEYTSKYGAYPYIDIPINGNGSFDIVAPTRWFSSPNPCGGTTSHFVVYKQHVRIDGWTQGSGAVLRVRAGGFAYNGADCACFTSGSFCYHYFTPPWTFEAAVKKKMGAGYSKDDNIVVTLPATAVHDGKDWQYFYGSGGPTTLHWENAMVIRAFQASDPENPGAGAGYGVKKIEIVDPGHGYLVAPQLKIVSETGFGAYATCTVKEGKIDTVTIENSGGGYKTPPKVEILAGGAEAFAVSRPHLRGLYQCYYRYTDDTHEDRGGPIPSNLSEVVELDAGEAATSVTWTVSPPTKQVDRITHVELWRSTSGQATTMYRVKRMTLAEAASPFLDDLTDEELRDPDRDGYAALPILLPNGELNAMRFVPPPKDKSAVVRFQDRMWYGIGGDLPNAIYYSETNEPESVPKENEVIIQQNDRDADQLMAMMPFGQTLFLAQERHLFSLTFSQFPLLDGQVSPVAFRGCVNQRCWQVHEGSCYAADRYGVYRFNQGGSVEELSDQISDIFEEKIIWDDVTWYFMAMDYQTKTLRLFVSHVDDTDTASGRPSRALCYDISSKTWWWEKYPQEITSSSQATTTDGSFRTVYGCESGMTILDAGSVDIARGAVLTAKITNRGAGYRTPPTVTAPGGTGAIFQAALNQDGSLASIWVLEPGHGYTSGMLTVSPPDDPTVDPASRVQAVAEFTASTLTKDIPVWPTFHFKTGNVEYPTDATSERGGSEERRDIRLAYKPAKGRNEVSVRMYYNNSAWPRHNIAERDRGTGFVDSVVDPASRLDLGRMTEEYGQDSGVARAIRTGKSLEDIRSNDRHVAVEVCGPRRTEDPVVFYTLDVFGGGAS